MSKHERSQDIGEAAAYLPLDRRRAASFIADHERMVRAQLRRMGAEDDDVLYRSFDRALRALPKFEGRSSLATWLYRIAYREALRHLERAQRIAARETPLPEGEAGDIMAGAAAAEDPESLLLRSESAAVVRAALFRLDPREREILALRYLEDLKLGEMADRLDMPLGTVKTRIHRALAKLRLELDHA